MGEGATAKLDVSVVEAGTGRECVRVRGLTSRALAGRAATEALPRVMEDVSARTALEVPVGVTEAAGAARAWEELLGKRLWGALEGLGLFGRGGRLDVEGWKAEVGLAGRYGRWLEESLRGLEGQGYLGREGEGWVVVEGKRPKPQAIRAEWEAYKVEALQDPERRAAVTLVDVTLGALPEVLNGERAATEVMFPHSSLELVEGIYRHNRIADYFNEVVAESVVAAVEAWRRRGAGGKLRLFEIGAGTGGTSAGLFARLAPYAGDIGEYCYTDVSKAFLQHAEAHYRAEAAYLTTRRFDVEQSLAGQGLEAGAFDVVIAANVLHATRDIRRTVRNAKALLKRGGNLNDPLFKENILTFPVAYGLALQGLGEARLHTNLLPGEIRTDRLIRAKKLEYVQYGAQRGRRTGLVSRSSWRKAMAWCGRSRRGHLPRCGSRERRPCPEGS